jgi:hypothetical protein
VPDQLPRREQAVWRWLRRARLRVGWLLVCAHGQPGAIGLGGSSSVGPRSSRRRSGRFQANFAETPVALTRWSERPSGLLRMDVTTDCNTAIACVQLVASTAGVLFPAGAKPADRPCEASVAADQHPLASTRRSADRLPRLHIDDLRASSSRIARAFLAPPPERTGRSPKSVGTRRSLRPGQRTRQRHPQKPLRRRAIHPRFACFASSTSACGQLGLQPRSSSSRTLNRF